LRVFLGKRAGNAVGLVSAYSFLYIKYSAVQLRLSVKN
jgi:hypothetical protein